MLHTTAVVYTGSSPELRVQVELDLDDLLPPAHGLMPVSFTGKFLDVGDSDAETVRTAKSVEIVFAGADMRYEAIINRETLEFRVIDTSERGV